MEIIRTCSGIFGTIRLSALLNLVESSGSIAGRALTRSVRARRPTGPSGAGAAAALGTAGCGALAPPGWGGDATL